MPSSTLPPADSPISDDATPATPLAIAPAPDMPLLAGEDIEQFLPASDDPEMADWLERPEAVVFVIFAVLVTLWQFYVDLLADADGDTLSGRALARRLDVNHSTISRRKDRDDFSQWTQLLDPDGIAWIYQNGRFTPLIDEEDSEAEED